VRGSCAREYRVDRVTAWSGRSNAAFVACMHMGGIVSLVRRMEFHLAHHPVTVGMMRRVAGGGRHAADGDEHAGHAAGAVL
jgi:hypothetical protein